VKVAHHLVAEAQADRDMAKLKLDRTEIRSPVDGIVMSRLKNPGDALMFSSSMADATQVLRVYDPKSLQVRVDVPLAEASKVGVGMPAEVIVGVLPNKVFKGEVTRVVHEADIQKNTLQVKVKIADPSVELKPEMLARVKFLSGSGHAGHGGTASGGGSEARALQVFAPEKLIAMEGIHGTAMVVGGGKKGSVAEARHVMLGNARQDGWVEVTSGLSPGDLLIASPLDKVRDGTKVRVVGDVN
jgi:RND family efflux transporter MFP subunit